MKVKILVFLSLGILFAYLLFPLSSRRFRIDDNRSMLEYKSAYLDGLRRSRPVHRRQSEEKRPPNIVIILADDLGKTDISLYGSPHVHTPHMDAIGQEGVTFTEAYCSAPICAPSRAGLLTGRYQQRFGFELQPHDRYPRNRLERLVYRILLRRESWVVSDAASFPRRRDIRKQGLPLSEITLGELLQSAGYATAIVGKWHLGVEAPFLPNERGFDYQYGFYEAFSLYADADDPDIVNHRHDHFANRHIWRRGRKGSSAIRRNHDVVVEDEYLTLKIARESVQFIREHRTEPFFLYVPFSAPHTPFQSTREYFDQFSHVQDHNRRVYYSMIKALDDAVGLIMSSLDEEGLDEETLVFFASDNGGATYTGATENAPLKGGKFSYFEGGLNVPFMMRWRGRLEPGILYHDPVILLDIFTTAVSAFSGELPQDRTFDGVDLMPFLRGERNDQPHDYLYWRSDYNRAVRHGRWKGIIDSRESTRKLYDLQQDKVEELDRFPSLSDQMQELENALRRWELDLQPPLWPRVMDYRFTIDGIDYYFAI